VLELARGWHTPVVGSARVDVDVCGFGVRHFAASDSFASSSADTRRGVDRLAKDWPSLPQSLMRTRLALGPSACPADRRHPHPGASASRCDPQPQELAQPAPALPRPRRQLVAQTLQRSRDRVAEYSDRAMPEPLNASINGIMRLTAS
jgi:hypothetical protein